MEISISDNLRKVCGEIYLVGVTAKVITENKNQVLDPEIDNLIANIKSTVKLEDICNIKQISDSRKLYKILGKDPNRYRISSEALLRRVLNNKPLYRINNIVDINNLVSMKHFYSVGSYDLEKINANMYFDIGKDGECYKGIGKDIINIANLPVFYQNSIPFGSPTSDSEIAMITGSTKEILMLVISFSGSDGTHEAIDYARHLLEKFANAKDIRIITAN